MLTLTLPTVWLRTWGREEILMWTPTHAGKRLERRAGTRGGFQFHVKEESHYLLTGSLLIETVEDGHVVNTRAEAGQAWTVPPCVLHRETALTDCTEFEVSDPTRNDRYGIVPDPSGLPSMTAPEAAQKLIELAAAFEQRAQDCRDYAAMIQTRGLGALVPDSLHVPA